MHSTRLSARPTTRSLYVLLWLFAACNAPAGTVSSVSSAMLTPCTATATHKCPVTKPNPTGAGQPNAIVSSTTNGSTATIIPMAGPPSTGTGAINTIPVDLGPNVLVFDANMSMATIQSRIDTIAASQAANHFGKERYAYLFKPGRYSLDVQINYMMTAAGLGVSPDDVTITGAVRSKASWNGGNATLNFWRAAENLAVVPTQDNNTMVWAVSQGTSLRRMHIAGDINLSDNGWSSGGFIADSRVDGVMNSGTQQQFLTRNDTLKEWQGKNWNMVFVGVTNPPAGAWPNAPYSVLQKTPAIREKPFLSLDDKGAYVVRLPPLKTASQGVGWQSSFEAPMVLPINTFYVAHADADNAETLNAALKKGLHLLFTPGIYTLTQSLQVTYKNTILMGLGLATLQPTQGTPAITVADVEGVTIAALLLDAGPVNSPTLLQLGVAGSAADHSVNPSALFDMSCRVGGAGAAKTSSCMVVHSNNVLLDNTWLWRADHGDGAGWNANPSLNGIIINGAEVTAYGLFSEHFQGYQTLWNGNGGRTYMYQSEFPYDPPNQSSWRHDSSNGYASYKVANTVTSHTALGMGMYCVFANEVQVDNAIEAPTGPGVSLNHLITVWLGVASGSGINHIINGTGPGVYTGGATAKSGT